MDNNQTISTTAPEKPARKFNLFEFIRETRREAAKVTWPTRKETLVTTAMIVIAALVAGIFFLGVDYVLGQIISRILGMRA